MTDSIFPEHVAQSNNPAYRHTPTAPITVVTSNIGNGGSCVTTIIPHAGNTVELLSNGRPGIILRGRNDDPSFSTMGTYTISSLATVNWGAGTIRKQVQTTIQLIRSTAPVNIPLENLPSDPRSYHAQTQLNNDFALISGGCTKYSDENAYGTVLNSVVIFDPQSNGGAGSFIPLTPMTIPRCKHTATLIGGAGGISSVLITGGQSTSKDPGGTEAEQRSAELYTYDSNTGVSGTSVTGSMATGRACHNAVWIQGTQQVVIFGGYKGWDKSGMQSLDTAEIYETASGNFRPVLGTMSAPRHCFTSTMQPETGQILNCGGTVDYSNVTNFADVYDPVTESFIHNDTFGNPMRMKTARADHCAIVISPTQILIAGGYTNLSNGTKTDTAEIFDFTTRTFTATGKMKYKRSNMYMSLLANGDVLVAGGSDSNKVFNTIEIYNVKSGRFSESTATLLDKRDIENGRVETQRSNGDILIAGGWVDDGKGGSTPTQKCEKIIFPVSNRTTANSYREGPTETQ